MTTDPWEVVDRLAQRAVPVDPDTIRAQEREDCARRITAWVAARTSGGMPTAFLRGALRAADVVREGR